MRNYWNQYKSWKIKYQNRKLISKCLMLALLNVAIEITDCLYITESSKPRNWSVTGSALISHTLHCEEKVGDTTVANSQEVSSSRWQESLYTLLICADIQVLVMPSFLRDCWEKSKPSSSFLIKKKRKKKQLLGVCMICKGEGVCSSMSTWIWIWSCPLLCGFWGSKSGHYVSVPSIFIHWFYPPNCF